jgi:hypothetical protein
VGHAFCRARVGDVRSTGIGAWPDPQAGDSEEKELMYFKTADVEGLRVFYREAGDPSK